jgi:hypothetical protein
MGFRRPNAVVAVGALPDVQFTTLQIHVFPAQAAKLRSPQAGEDDGYEQCAPFADCRINQPLDLVRSRNVDAGLKLSLGTLVDPDGNAKGNVLGHIPAPLRLPQQGFEAHQNLTGEGT